MDRETVVRRLTELFGRMEDVEVAVLFGSLARGSEHPRDIDIAVKLATEKSLLDLAKLVVDVSSHLGLPEERIDIVDLGSAKPILLLRVLEEGIVLKGDPESLARLYEEASRGVDQLTEIRLWGTLDPEPKVDKPVLVSRAEEVRRNSEFLKGEILTRSARELSYKDVLALERAVHRIAEAMLDVCRHLVAVHSLGLAESYGEYPRRLAQRGLMPRDLAEEVAELAGLRDILVHRYLEADTEKLHEAAKRIAEEVAPKFLNWVKKVDP